MKNKRSISVTIFGILFFIFGIMSLSSGIKGIGATSQSLFNSVMNFIFAGLGLACGYGVLSLRHWGRRMALFYAIFISLFNIIWWLIFGKRTAAVIMEQRALKGISGPEVSWVGLAVTSLFSTFLVAGIIVFFFSRPKVKEQFKN